ncbi:hypothetical protein ACWC5I_41380, partial [Kitasatospora sp. NPDC001574]
PRSSPRGWPAPASEPAAPAPARRSRARSAPLETVLRIARESLADGVSPSARGIAATVRARGIGIGTTRAEQVAAILKAERVAANLEAEAAARP